MSTSLKIWAWLQLTHSYFTIFQIEPPCSGFCRRYFSGLCALNIKKYQALKFSHCNACRYSCSKDERCRAGKAQMGLAPLAIFPVFEEGARASLIIPKKH